MLLLLLLVASISFSNATENYNQKNDPSKSNKEKEALRVLIKNDAKVNSSAIARPRTEDKPGKDAYSQQYYPNSLYYDTDGSGSSNNYGGWSPYQQYGVGSNMYYPNMYHQTLGSGAYVADDITKRIEIFLRSSIEAFNKQTMSQQLLIVVVTSIIFLMGGLILLLWSPYILLIAIYGLRILLYYKDSNIGTGTS